MEGTPLSNARDWLAENPLETIAVASRLFGVPDSTIWTSIKRLAQPRQPQRQQGGLNKIPITAQIEALKKWIIRQFKLGLRATR